MAHEVTMERNPDKFILFDGDGGAMQRIKIANFFMAQSLFRDEPRARK